MDYNNPTKFKWNQSNFITVVNNYLNTTYSLHKFITGNTDLTHKNMLKVYEVIKMLSLSNKEKELESKQIEILNPESACFYFEFYSKFSNGFVKKKTMN